MRVVVALRARVVRVAKERNEVDAGRWARCMPYRRNLCQRRHLFLHPESLSTEEFKV